MAINGLTYYVSVDSPNFKILDANNVATTSATTTGLSIRKATESVYYNNLPVISRSSYNVDTQLIITNELTTVSSYSSTDNYIQAQASNITVGVSVPADYTDTGTSIIRTDWWHSVSLAPSFKMTWDSALNLYVAESKSSEYSYTSRTLSGDLAAFNVNDGTSNVSIFRFMTTSSESSATGTSTLTDRFIAYNVTATTTANTGYSFSSSSNDDYVTLYSSSFYNDTVKHRTIWKTYNVDANGVYTSTVNIQEQWNTYLLALDQKITTKTTWVNITSNTQSTATYTNFGAIADENGNVMAGTLYGYGKLLELGSYGSWFRPAVITSFDKRTDVSTVDTSWFGTYYSTIIVTNSTRTVDKWIEFNNYGIGGVMSQGTYYWNTSSGTAYSESSRTDNVYLYYDSALAYASITIPVANRITSVISDNSYPRQSETKTTISRSEQYDYGSYGTSASITSSETLSEEIANTRTNFTTSFSVDFSITAGNYYLSITNDYTTSGIGSHTSYSTTFYEATETSSCNVTSYSNNNGYSYYTTFYGELANETFYATSWVNSAVVSSTSYKNEVGLTRYKVNEIYKTFGDIVNSTTIRDINTIGSTVFTSREMSRINSTTYNSSGTSKAVDVPVETYFTYGTTYRDATTYSSYYGPKYDYGDYSFDLDVSVTEIGSHQDSYAIDYSTSTSSVINTTAYGGTTYRLSELISSSSGIIIGNSNMTESYAYDYDVKSMFSLNDYIATLSNYTTRLSTSYTSSYDTRDEYDDYYVTMSTSLAARSTGERFIDRVEISRIFTSNYYVTYTVAMYNYSTIGTVSSSTRLGYTQSEQDASTVARTFISSTADLDITTEIASSATATSARGSFIYSSRELVSSMTEQQNDTLIFASTFNTYSFYNSTYTTSTLNTVASTLSATTYEDWYSPISWTSTALSIATSTGVTETVNTTSGVVSVTQSVNYTPTYNDVDGIYVTTN